MSAFYPLVDVAVVLIGRGERLLLDWKPRWSAFSLPIAKFRELPESIPGGDKSESPQQAALRAAVEVLGMPLPPDGLPERIDVDIEPYRQSQRDGLWKRYQFHVYGMRTNVTPVPLPGHAATWLAPEKVLTHQPLSPTVSHVLNSVPMTTIRKLLS